MLRTVSCAAVLALGLGAIAPTGAAFAADQSTYVFTSWQAGWIGHCLITENHTTADCEPAPAPNESILPADLVDKYLNNQPIPDAPVGKRVSVLVKLREPVRGEPPDAAQAEITALHLRDLQRQYYPRATLSAKLEGKVSVDCAVLDNGQLDNCWVANETPTDAGFGDATLRLINLMKLTSPLPADRKRHFDMTWQLPGPAERVFVECLVTSEITTSDCTTDPDPDYPGAADAVLRSLKNQPLHPPGAPVGQRIEVVLIRSELGKPQTVAGEGVQTTPYKPVRLTPLNANDVLYYYPPLSIRLEETGYSVARCKVTDDGRLNECWASGNFARLNHAQLRLTEMIRMQSPEANSRYDRRFYGFQVTWTLKQ